MIRIGVQTEGIQGDYSIDETYGIIAETGFDAADANIDQLFSPGDILAKKAAPAFSGSDRECLEYVRPWRDAALKYGVENYQAHAPFPSMIWGDDEYNDYLMEVLRKSIICCDYIGCRNLIIHPFFLPYEHALTRQQEWEINLERYARLIPQARECGVTICLENMFTGYRGKLYSACCGTAAEAARYVDELNRIAGDECFAFCLDTGHLLLAGQEVRRTMHAMGHRIRAFHVHDNDGVLDQHLAPYLGVFDWDGFVQGLAEIGFDRTMCFETFRSWQSVGPGVRRAMLQYIHQAGRCFARDAAAMLGE